MTLWHRRFRGVASILGRTYRSWRAHRTIRLGAGLAYYGLFSLTSVLAVTLGLVGIVGRSQTVEDAIVIRVEELVGPSGAATVASFFERLTGSSGASIGLIGLGSLLITGSLFFLALEDAIQQIWDIPVRGGITISLRRRLVSLLVLLGTALTLVVAVAVQAVANVFDRLVPGSAPLLQAVSAVLTALLGLGVLAAALALLFRFLPSAAVGWIPATIAATVTAALLVVGTIAIGWYLRTVGVASVGGVASTPIVILVWIYYEAQILLAGVHLSRVLEER